MFRAIISICLILVSAIGLASDGLEQEVLSALKERAPDRVFEIVGPNEIHYVGDDDETVNRIYLDNLSRSLPEEGEARREQVEAFAASVLEPVTTGLGDADRNSIFPVVRDRGFLDQYPKGGPATLMSQPLFGDLVTLYVLDYPDRIQYLLSTDLEELGVSEDELHDLAVTNFSQSVGEVTLEQMEPVFTITFDGDVSYLSSFLFLDSLWDEIDRELGDRVIVAVPSREIVFFAADPGDDGLWFFESLNRNFFEQEAYPVSSKLLQRRAKRFHLLD